MSPPLSLAGLNRLRGAIALLAGAIAAGLSLFSRSVEGGPALADQAMLSALWIYVGVTAVPWADLKGRAGSGVTSALTIGAWTVYLTAVTGFTGWSVAEHDAWHAPPPAVQPPRCVPEPAAADGGAPDRPAPPRIAEAPAASPPSTPPSERPDAAAMEVAATPDATTPDVATSDAATPDAAAPQAVSGDAAAEPEGRRRSRRRRRDDEEDDDSSAPPAVWLERDPAARPQ